MQQPQIAQLGAEEWRTERGVRWLAELDSQEAMLTEIGEALLAQASPKPGMNIIDIGCGGGWTSRMAAKAAGPDGHVCGLDISPELVAEAQRRAQAEGIGNLDFVCGDASASVPENAPFDILMSRFGVMFFSDPLAAFRHMRGLLKPGGMAHFAVWAAPQENRWMTGMGEVVGRHIPLPPPDPAAPGPFSLSDPAHFGALLSDAGFGMQQFTPWRGFIRPGAGLPPDKAADFAVRIFAFADMLEKAEPEVRDAVCRDLTLFFEGYDTPGGVAVPGTAWLVRAGA